MEHRKHIKNMAALVIPVLLVASLFWNSDRIRGEENKTGAAAGNKTKITRNISEIPAAYKKASKKKGTVHKLTYKTAAEDKYAYVYTPYGYKKSKKYDILYLMHGGGGNAEMTFGDGYEYFKNVVDNLIRRKKMRPILIVAPTFYTEKNPDTDVGGSWDAVKEFPDELINYLMPAVEGEYSTFAKTTDDKGFRKSRKHRTFGGFSMGAVTTWYVFEKHMVYFGNYIPVSGDSWTSGMQGGSSKPKATAASLAKAVKKQGYGRSSFRIYAMTGSEDIAEPMMTSMTKAMAGKKIFRFSEIKSKKGNISYIVARGGYHDRDDLNRYLYYLFPKIWKKK